MLLLFLLINLATATLASTPYHIVTKQENRTQKLHDYTLGLYYTKGLYPDPYLPESGASAKGGFKETCLLTCYKQLKFLSDTQKSDIMYALQSNIERLVDDSDPDSTMVSHTEANCLINDQSPYIESEASLVPTDSQITSDGDIPACKKLKNLL